VNASGSAAGFALADKPVNEPGHTTVQLLVAFSALLAVIELIAATKVQVFRGDRVGWWVAIQGSTVTSAAACAGAAAGACGAWASRTRQRATSTTVSSLWAGIGASLLAAAVFSVLCWAAIALPSASNAIVPAVIVAAVTGGFLGSFRLGGAVLGGLVAVSVGTLVALGGQAAVGLAVQSVGGSMGFEAHAVVDALAALTGTLSGCWWLFRRRQHTNIGLALVVGLFGSALLLTATITAALAGVLAGSDPGGEARATYLPMHGYQVAIWAVVGFITALVAARFQSKLRQVRVGTRGHHHPEPASAKQTISAP
jgi:hypothetical protein